MRTSRGFELTYCSNIHPADGWKQVFEKLQQIPPALKKRISPNARFGIGLRLSNQESVELRSGDCLAEFGEFLQANDLYVSLINGFPFAGFHDCRLKDQVFAPDWHTDERVDYTLRLAHILATLLPEGLEGGISTSPLSYKRWNQEPRWDALIANVIRVVAAMVEAKRDHGALIHLDIEPEPDGLIENTAEFIAFFGRLLAEGAPILEKATGFNRAQAEEAIRQHVTICYDVCHFAVEYEDPAETINAFRSAGIGIGRAQISSAIRVALPPTITARETLRRDLFPLADSTYLHQVIGNQERFGDLPEGLARLDTAASDEWRIHYHVPLFVESYGRLGSTQAQVRRALSLFTPDLVRQLEIETYTWGVLPPDLKLDIVDSIEREYRWVLNQI